MPDEKDIPSGSSDNAPERQGDDGEERQDRPKAQDANPLAPPVNIGAGS